MCAIEEAVAGKEYTPEGCVLAKAATSTPMTSNGGGASLCATTPEKKRADPDMPDRYTCQKQTIQSLREFALQFRKVPRALKMNFNETEIVS
ncbi:hypothetical protein JTB14_008100 [Gonioctena quinquepunctata]|nr:hypothetical protein JTB14_008100 [Gonioctena quinquepunctata]